MKHIFALLLCIAGIHAQTQVQNGGFEALNSEQLPYYWKWISDPILVVIDTTGVPDSVTFVGGRYELNDMEVHTGQHAMEIGNGYNFTAQTAYTGRLVATYDTFFVGGFPIDQVFLTERPESVHFFAEYFPEADDSAFVEVRVMDEYSNEVGYASLLIGGTVSSYTEFVLPITYTSSDSAAYMALAFQTSAPNGTASLNTRLLIDDVTVVNMPTGVAERELSDLFTVYPNPVDAQLTIAGPIDANVTSAQVADALGRTRSLSVNTCRQVDLSALAAGVYQFSFRTALGVVSKPLVVVH